MCGAFGWPGVGVGVEVEWVGKRDLVISIGLLACCWFISLRPTFHDSPSQEPKTFIADFQLSVFCWFSFLRCMSAKGTEFAVLTDCSESSYVNINDVNDRSLRLLEESVCSRFPKAVATNKACSWTGETKCLIAYCEEIKSWNLTLWSLTTPYSGRTAPLTSKVSFYIFIQQI